MNVIMVKGTMCIGFACNIVPFTINEPIIQLWLKYHQTPSGMIKLNIGMARLFARENESDNDLRMNMYCSICLISWMIAALCLSQKAQSHDNEWYKTTSIYQVYTRSFMDSNNDGNGDLKGILEKLDYIQDLGFETIFIESILKSPFIDGGYDVSDHEDVDPIFGTTKELKNLIDEIHDRGMKILLDFVPNHTSVEHEWFKRSVNREAPYTDFYVWENPRKYDPETNQPIPLNNWISNEHGSMWKWNNKRNQFYLHQFLPEQPDLNYRNRAVREAMKEVFRFWLNLGVDGFRVDAIGHLIEDAMLRDNPWKPGMFGVDSYHAQIHKYSKNQEETYEVSHEWRLLLDEYGASTNKSRVMGFESFDPPATIQKHMGNETYKNLHFHLAPFILDRDLNSSGILNWIQTQLRVSSLSGAPSWSVGNHDWGRVGDKGGPEISLPTFMIIFLLPGVVTSYYGEEISMTELPLRPDQEDKDPHDANKYRTPMQWDDSPNSGFTKKRIPWLPVNPNYWSINVKRQAGEKDSQLNNFKRLMELRKTPTVRNGELAMCTPTPWLFVFQRYLDGEAPIVVVVNLGTEMEVISVNDCSFSLLREMEIHTASPNSGFKTGDKLVVCNANDGTHCPELRPRSGLVLTSISSSASSIAGIPVHPLLTAALSLAVSSFLWKYY
nr:PREDICTED: maltase A2-like isoform X1 [Bemisia tabaci]